MTTYTIALLPGDGIGPEITQAAVSVLSEAARLSGELELCFTHIPASATHWLQHGMAMTDEHFAACAAADAMLMGAIGLPEARHPDGREVNGDVIFRLRFDLDLYAGVRPIRRFHGVPCPLTGDKPVDYVVVRENVEGLYASSGGGTNVRGEVATDTIVITERGTRRVTEAGLRLLRRRHGRPSDGRRVLTCVDKANVLSSYAFFREIFDKTVHAAADAADLSTEHFYIDAMCAMQVLHPDRFDVVVAENMFGDITSDLGAATVGGLGMAPSGDIGDSHGLFQPSHGSAPDIAGRGIANPVAMILSAAMMLDWLASTRGDPVAGNLAEAIDGAASRVLARGDVLTPDLGGSASTTDVAKAIARELGEHAILVHQLRAAKSG
jgi:3-isopropylmalate dehydrogenase